MKSWKLQVSWFLVAGVLLAVAPAVHAQSGSNGVYGGYVGSSSWFALMRQSAEDQAMLRSLGGKTIPGTNQVTIPPGYVEIAGIIHFTVRNPFPDGRLPDLHIQCANRAADQALRSPFIQNASSPQPDFYTILKTGETYNFSWMYFMGSIQPLGSWRVPASAPRQVRLVLNVDMKGNVRIEGMGIAGNPPPPPPAASSERGNGGYPLQPAGGPYQGPQSDGAYQPPQAGPRYVTPQVGPGYVPPRTDNSWKPPATGPGYVPPQTDNSWRPPQSDHAFRPPATGAPAPPLPPAVRSMASRMHALPAAPPSATPAPPTAARSSSTLQVNPNQFDLTGLSTPPKNAQQAALWKQILAATTPAEKARAHQALSAYYQRQGKTALALREALRAQYWAAGGHW